MRRDLPRGTVTFLFTDIEGSTRLLHELGERYAEVLAEHRRLLREAFAAHGGVEVDTQGDAFFYAFARASDALRAAEEGRRALEATPVRVRIGVHTGEPVVTDEGYVGMDVHRGARVAAAGHGGQVLVSEEAARLAGLEGLVDLGLHRLKDLTAPQRLFQLGEGEFPPPKTLYQTNLPVPSTPFLGRERELEAVGALLARDDVRLVTLTGPGGSGKTRLALQAAAAAAGGYPDGVWWVPLAPLSEAAAVAETAARALGGGGGPLAETIGDRRLLLLLDNFEHVIDAAGDLAHVLARCPRADLLVTSRERLQLSGEHVYAVPGLAREEARALFAARAGAVSDFQPDESVDELCSRLDDLPLALELAAARTATFSTRQLLDRLAGQLELLRGGRDADARQQTLVATIRWSYDLLEEEERQLFARLAVFRAGCTLEAAEDVCEARPDVLEALVDKSLVRRSAGRFWMLETIREFAGERLAESGELEELRRRHAEALFALAEDVELQGELRDQQLVERRLERVRTELDDVRAAFGWSLEHDPVAGLRAAAALESFWITAPIEGVRWLRALLERAADAPRELRARALRAYGGAANPAGQNELAQRAYEESLSEFRALGDEAGAATLLLRLGYAALYRGDLRAARSLAEESLERSVAARDRRGEAQSVGLLGELDYAEGARASGRERMERSAALAGETGFSWWRAGMLGKLGDHAFREGRLDAAAEHVREALELSHQLGDRLRVVRGLARLTRIAAHRGHARRAGELWGALEAEERRGPVGAWEAERAGFEEAVRARADRGFELGREAGRGLSLDEAVSLAQRDDPTREAAADSTVD